MASTLAAVIFDWAGTVIDYGCCAPAQVFQSTFANRGIQVTTAQAREPMGMAKWDHIRAICDMPSVQAAWRERYGEVPSEQDVQALYAEFLPLQKAVLLDHALLIPGAAAVCEFLKARDVAVGSSTGYTRELMEMLLPEARRQGFEPGACLCADDVPAGGRPKPYLIWENLKLLDRFPTSRVVKVDDTPVGIQAGLNAGCITVAVAKSGNELGLSAHEVAALAPDQLSARLASIRKQFYALGAHYVVDSVADLPTLIEQIEQQLSS